MLAKSFNLVSPLDDLPEEKSDYGDQPQPPTGAFKWSLLVLWLYVPILSVVIGLQLFCH